MKPGHESRSSAEPSGTGHRDALAAQFRLDAAHQQALAGGVGSHHAYAEGRR